MLKYHPKFGIYDLSFKAAVKSLIKDGFIDSELIDNLYTENEIDYSECRDMPLEEAKAAIRAEFSPWVWLCRTNTVDCVKLKSYATDANGDALYTWGGYTRTCNRYFGYKATKWQGHYGTLEHIRRFCTERSSYKLFVTVCNKNSKGALEPVGYVLI